MKNKLLLGLVIVLGLGFIFQGFYILRLKRKLCRAYAARQLTARGQRPHPAGRYPQRPCEIDPFAEIQRLQCQMHRMFADDFPGEIWSRGPRIMKRISTFEPDLSVKDSGAAYLIIVDLPGMKKEDIKAEVKGRFLTISGERKEQESREEKGYLRQELNYGSFLRTLPLPDDANVKEAGSEYKNGVLTVKLPKDKAAQARDSAVKIEIK